MMRSDWIGWPRASPGPPNHLCTFECNLVLCVTGLHLRWSPESGVFRYSMLNDALYSRTQLRNCGVYCATGCAIGMTVHEPFSFRTQSLVDDRVSVVFR